MQTNPRQVNSINTDRSINGGGQSQNRRHQGMFTPLRMAEDTHLKTQFNFFGGTMEAKCHLHKIQNWFGSFVPARDPVNRTTSEDLDDRNV